MNIENRQKSETTQGAETEAFSEGETLRILNDQYILGPCWLPSTTGDIYAAWDVTVGIDNLSANTADHPPAQFFIKFLPDNDPHATPLSHIIAVAYKELTSCFSWCKQISLVTDTDTCYLVLELPQGEFLSKKLEATKVYGDLAAVLPLLTNLNTALNNLQQCGIQHGRVAPDSIFILHSGAVGLVDSLYVVAKQRLLVEDHEGATTIPNREALYASPDVCFGRGISEQDDVFSMACLCYYLLSGEHPFAGSNSVSALLNKTRAQPLGSLSEAEWQHLEYGLSFSPESRQKTTSDFINGFATASKSPNTIKKRNKETATARKNAQKVIRQKKQSKTVNKKAIAKAKLSKKTIPKKLTASATESSFLQEITLPRWSWVPLSLLAGISLGAIAMALSIYLLDVNLFAFVDSLR
jgi:serine/threonine protein kinase